MLCIKAGELSPPSSTSEPRVSSGAPSSTRLSAKPPTCSRSPRCPFRVRARVSWLWLWCVCLAGDAHVPTDALAYVICDGRG